MNDGDAVDAITISKKGHIEVERDRCAKVALDEYIYWLNSNEPPIESLAIGASSAGGQYTQQHRLRERAR